MLFFKNTAILTATNLALRLLGLVFKVYLSGAVGSEGIGLYQLIFSVYMLANTLGTTGISVCVTRLVSDELALGNENGVKQILKKSVAVATLFAFFCGGIVFLFTEKIAFSVIGDVRCTLSLKILSPSLPFMAVSACIKGYFTARRKSLPPCFAGVFEQLVRIFLTLIFVKNATSVEASCAAILTGDLVAESAASFLIFVFLVFDFKHLKLLKGRNTPPFKISKEILRISLPISFSRLINTLLRTAENLLVPLCLIRFGFEKSAAVSLFGMIKGMALPLLFFPSSLLQSVSSLLIPEICEAKAKGLHTVAKREISKSLKLTCLSGLFLGFFFLFCGGTVSNLLYKESEVANLVVLLAPLTVFMYLDSVADGILKGLDQQNFSFKVAVSDSALRLIATPFIVSRFGILGFVGIMYFSNLYTCLLNCFKLISVSGIRFKFWRNAFLPTFFAFCAALLTNTAVALFKFSALPFVVVFALVSLFFFFTLLILSGTTSKEEIRNLIAK